MKQKSFNNKSLIVYNVTPINTDVTDLEKFEEKVIKAKQLGATHIIITETIKDRWFWEQDLSDPYPNWGMLNASLFKIIIPEELKPWLPKEYAQKNYELILNRSRILRKHNLKAAAYFCEPFYLPEDVFRVHPSWRGPRCDHPRRSRRAYYSPCMDNPEVLSMYKKTMKQMCEVCDIEYVYLHTNDCGAGICWSNGLYVGPNGPETCKDIPLSERLINYFRVFKEGAQAAGKDIYIETNSKIGVKETDAIMESLWPSLEDKTAVNFKTNKGTPLTSLVDLNYEFTLAPVRNIPLAIELIEMLENAYYEDSEILRVVVIDQDFDLMYRIIDAFQKNPTNGVASRFALLEKIASSICSDPTTLVNAWYHIHKGLKHLYSTLMEGFTWISVNQRLINRPFVLFPNELKEEEKSYYRPFQFQAGSEEDANDLLNNQGSGFIKGYYAVFLATKALEKSLKKIQEAQKEYKKIMRNIIEPKLLSQFKLAFDRLELLQCFIKNYLNAMNFQQVIDETDYNDVPKITLKWPQDQDLRLTNFERINRNEIDNTYRVIELIKGREKEMLFLAPSIEQEDIFWLTEKITEQLYKKANIMINHQLDGKRLYVSGNK